MDPTQKVWYPYVVMLHNLPFKMDELTGKPTCCYSNREMTRMIARFAGKLKNTIKIVYNKDGVVLYNNAAFAYAQFHEFQHALMVSQCFSVENRGKHAYESIVNSNHGQLGDIVFGWMADKSDFNLLAAMGTKRFLNKVKELTIQQILEIEHQKREDMRETLEEDKKKSAAKDQELRATQQKLNKLLADLSEKNMAITKDRVELEKETAKRAAELKTVQAAHEQSLNEIRREERTVREEHRRMVYDNKEREKFNRQRDATEQEYFEAKEEQDAAEKRTQTEREELAQVARTALETQEQTEAYIRQLDEIRKKTEALYSSEQTRQRVIYQSAKEEGLRIDYIECSMCFEEYTKVMTFEEQLEAKISAAELDKMNLSYDDDQRRWRTVAFPCGHARICGQCANMLIEDAEKWSKKIRCPTCRGEVKSFRPLRVSHT